MMASDEATNGEKCKRGLALMASLAPLFDAANPADDDRGRYELAQAKIWKALDAAPLTAVEDLLCVANFAAQLQVLLSVSVVSGDATGAP